MTENQNIACPYCEHELFGHIEFEAKCYKCHRYFYRYRNLDDFKKRLLQQVKEIAGEYVPQHVRNYLKKTDLSQSGPVILQWYRRQEEQAAESIAEHIEHQADDRLLESCLRTYEGTQPFLHELLEALEYPVKRHSLEHLDSDGQTDEY